MTWVMWILVTVHLDIVLVLVQDRCIVCAKHTILSGNILDALMVLIGEETQVNARFGLF